jgi:hypothetical protein
MPGNMIRMPLGRERKEIPEGENIFAVVAVRGRPFAGPAHAVFRYAIVVWKRICGVLPAAA